MVSRFFILIACGLLVFPPPLSSQPVSSAPGADLNIAGLQLNPTGTFLFDGLDFGLLHFGLAWERTAQKTARAEPGYPRRYLGEHGPTWETSGVLLLKGSAASLSSHQRMTALGDRAFEVDYQVVPFAPPDSSPGTGEEHERVPTQEFSLEARLPATMASGRSLLIDDTPCLLPAESKGMLVLSTTRARTLRLPSASGMVLVEADDSMLVRVEDMRAWKYPSFDYRVRIRFPLHGKSLEKTGIRLRLSHLDKGDDRTPVVPSPPLVMKADAEWAPYAHSVEIESGSVFDFSFLADGPAGKYGALVATPDGHFEFVARPGERVRLWGVNLCFSANYLEKNEADRLAVRLAASGYNTVRFHHYDAGLVEKGSRSDRNFDPAQLDKLDYLFAAMKRHGLYINLDLFTVRSWHFTKEEKAEMGIEGTSSESVYQFKALVPVSDVALENWKNFARTLLTHRNPYTGLTWAEDPALIGICPINEDVLAEERIARIPALHACYQEAFEHWWSQADNRSGISGNRDMGYARFLCERHIDTDRRMHGFLHSLGTKALLTGVNFQNMQSLAYVRKHYDVVDNHQYWAHPKGLARREDGRRLTGFAQGSAVRFAGEVPRGIMQSRLWGKPYTVTEFNFLSPNQYRAEGGVLMPAYASLQNWSALYNFEYAARRAYAMDGGTARTFSLTADPVGLLADRVSALIFRRGDVTPARRAIGFAIHAADAFRQGNAFVPEVFTRLGLVARIGSGTGAPEEELARHALDAVVVSATGMERGSTPATPAARRIYPADEATLVERLQGDGILPPDSVDKTGTRFRSDTGEIELDAKAGTLKVVTGRSELFVLPADHSLDGARVSAKNGKSFATVSVVSVDGQLLSESGRILVLHLTDALPSGTRFTQPDRSILEAWGEPPHLVKAGETDITLRLADSEHVRYRAWAVDATGRRIRETPLQKTGAGWLLRAETVTPDGAQLAYEIERQ
ncbi:MAG: hypothetical protein LBK99_09355 [Opitutaceae bacterium]|jgi:hypothetical protein|nr:hypothetical protein [Opitutaceae bacterium]